MDESQKEQIIKAIAAYSQAVEKDPSLADCSMCKGSGVWRYGRHKQDCPRCEGSGRSGTFVVWITNGDA